MKPNEQERSETAGRLVEAAIAEIEKHGLARLTVRGVAAAAEVNIAAVNYHFRTKDALVAAALEGTIRHMVDDSEVILERMAEDPEAVLGELFGYYLEGSRRFPRIGKAHLHEGFIAEDYSGPFPTLFLPVMVRLRDGIRAAVPGLRERNASQRMIAALSGVFFPSFFAGLYQPFDALGSGDDRAAYARELARQALAPVAPAKKARAKRGSS